MSILNHPPTKLFYRLNDLKHRVGVSGSTIWAWVKQGKFPQPVKLSENCTAWTSESVETWAKERIAVSQKAGV
jgi:prophage regulatory protein